MSIIFEDKKRYTFYNVFPDFKLCFRLMLKVVLNFSTHCLLFEYLNLGSLNFFNLYQILMALISGFCHDSPYET